MQQIQHPDGSVTFEADGAVPDIISRTISEPADLREAAYRAEADQYLAAYIGYTLERRSEEAQKQKDLYLARKTQIRTMYPDE